jgi:hypothetical protein
LPREASFIAARASIPRPLKSRNRRPLLAGDFITVKERTAMYIVGMIICSLALLAIWRTDTKDDAR